MSRIPSLLLSTLGTVLLFGCGGGDSPSSSAPPPGGGVAAPAPTPPPSPSPAPAPAPAPPTTGSIVGTDTQDGFPQLDAIATNFSLEGTLRPSWNTGAIPEEASETSPGAFRFICKASHLAYDDPIVFPNQKGRSHLHLFFGNTQADGDSTYESLRTTGMSTCNNALNRSAYWMPALMNGRGQVVMPEYIMIYYKRPPQSDAACSEGRGCIGLPRGLRYVFGRTMSGGNRHDSFFDCQGPGAVRGHYDTLVEAAQHCPVGASIGVALSAPECWNGLELDSPDHRSHMAYAEHSPTGKHCPATHPYRIPTFTLTAWWPVDETLDRSGNMSPDADTWYFASDRMPGMPPQVSGATFHSDWFGAWDDNTMATWIANCIDKHLSCSGGDLGNGTQLSYSPEHIAERPHLVAAPPAPSP